KFSSYSRGSPNPDRPGPRKTVIDWFGDAEAIARSGSGSPSRSESAKLAAPAATCTGGCASNLPAPRPRRKTRSLFPESQARRSRVPSPSRSVAPAPEQVESRVGPDPQVLEAVCVVIDHRHAVRAAPFLRPEEVLIPE